MHIFKSSLSFTDDLSALNILKSSSWVELPVRKNMGEISVSISYEHIGNPYQVFKNYCFSTPLSIL